MSRVWWDDAGYGCGALVEPLSEGLANDYNGVSSRVAGCGGSEEPVEHSGGSLELGLSGGSIMELALRNDASGLLCLVE